MVVAAPILNAKNELVGVLGGVLNLHKPNLLGSIASRKNGKNGYYYLVSGERVRIAHPDPSLVLQAVPPNSGNEPFERAMRGFEGTLEGTNTKGMQGLFTFARLHTTDWVVGSVIPTEEAFAPIRQVYQRMLQVTLVMLLLFLPLLWLFSRRLVRPFMQLAVAMERTAQRMREGLAVRAIEARGGREIRQVTQAFNAFVEARLQAEHELSVARDAAQSANASKSQFLANMSHEIRTPMNGILGMTDLCLQTQMTQEQRSYVSMVNTSARSLLGVINDILDFSKIEARKLELDPHEFSVHQLVRDCSRTLSLRAAEKNLEMTCTVAPDVPRLLIGDPLRLQQVLTNLRANAIKFKARGEIVLTVSLLPPPPTDAGVWLEWSVQDSGIGIAHEKQAMIFDTFTQADAGTARRFGGSGLGLAISRSLVEMMGGRIRVQSEPGQGSVFSFTTRLGAVRHGPLQSEELHQHLQGAQVLVVDDNASNPRWLSHAPSAASAQQPLPPAHEVADQCWRVLLAEDTPVNQILINTMLTRMGHEVTVVSNGLQALDAYISGSFDLVLMDIQMPEMSGQEATEAIRALEHARGRKHIPVIAVTAHALKGDRERYLEAGMDGYVSKPIAADALRTEIQRCMSRR